ncbi:triosephosphate isomerase [Physcia stellaris]|nr:triosephosphate isomerase [Physcia stellaris]
MPLGVSAFVMSVTASETLPKRLVGVSLKMYFDFNATESYIQELRKTYKGSRSSCGIFVIPSPPLVRSATVILGDCPHISVGAQDCHWEDKGAYTGETSPLLLKQIGCTIVELGHAERRRPPNNEDDAMVAKKAQAAIRNGLVPLVCIGEKGKSKIASEGVGIATRECVPQVMAVLDAVPQDTQLIFAYEPVWAIGAEQPASADHVCTVVQQLKNLISQKGRTGEVRILYGGSAGPGTWDTLKSAVDGLFLGRFAHDIGNFKQVVSEMEQE